jgi:hypothetical protein
LSDGLKLTEEAFKFYVFLLGEKKGIRKEAAKYITYSLATNCF